jgi:glycosyltransferase involved in cell wall biosynthesis
VTKQTKINNIKQKSKPFLSIVTPVYNEGDNFPALYETVKKNIKIPHKLIVVYDFDEDNTLPVARRYQKKDASIILHKNIKGQGVLNALLAGLDYVKEGPLLVIMGDLSDDLKIVNQMYKEYINGATIVCPSRYVKGGKEVGGPFFKRMLSRIAGTSLYYVRGLPTHDITNNFRLYDKNYINTIDVESNGGFEVAMEITVKAFRDGKKIVELPTTWMDRTAGEAKFKMWKWLPSYLRWYVYAFGPKKKMDK